MYEYQTIEFEDAQRQYEEYREHWAEDPQDEAAPVVETEAAQ